jgi:hypothetical protein
LPASISWAAPRLWRDHGRLRDGVLGICPGEAGIRYTEYLIAGVKIINAGTNFLDNAGQVRSER